MCRWKLWLESRCPLSFSALFKRYLYDCMLIISNQLILRKGSSFKSLYRLVFYKRMDVSSTCFAHDLLSPPSFTPSYLRVWLFSFDSFLLPCRKRTQYVGTEKKATNVCWVICIPSFGQGDNPEGHFYSPCWEYLMIPR